VRSLQSHFAILAALVATSSVLAGSAQSAEPAAVNEAAVDRMIDLNRKAYTDIQEQHFQAAKYRLTEALVISETAGLEDGEMTARTYVHMAAVYLTGLKDREEAIQQFMLALRINPNITITPGLESPALKSAYLQAREQMGLPPNPDTTAPIYPPVPPVPPVPPAADAATVSAQAGGQPPANNAKAQEWAQEPDLPARVPAPLYCQLPFDTPPGQDVVVRCLTQKQHRKSSAAFHYRPRGSEGEFVGIPMERSPKGWLTAVVPGRAIQGKSLMYYVQAEIPDSPSALYLGHPEAPNELIIRNPPVSEGAEDAAEEPESGAGSTSAPAASGGDIPRPSRLRAPGSIWFAVGGGTGAAYHGREPVDSNAKIPETNTPVRAQSGFSPMTLFQIEPEIGYQLSRRFSLSVLGRYQYAPNGYSPSEGETAIPTSAYAGFVRGQFAFLSKGGFQTYASGGAGFGTAFLAVVGKHCNTSASCGLDHSDTLHGGSVALTAGVGAIYHFNPRFGIFLDVKEIATLPKLMAGTEVNVGVAFAHRVLGPEGEKNRASTGRASWR
jgi:hypothetical protein